MIPEKDKQSSIRRYNLEDIEEITESMHTDEKWCVVFFRDGTYYWSDWKDN